MNPSPFTYRVPSDAEVQRILRDAAGKGSQTPEGKAKSNLLRSLDWAYTGLSLPARGQLVYHGRTALGQALQHKDTVSDADIQAMRNCLVARSLEQEHPGNSIQPLTDGQKRTLKQITDWYENVNRDIAARLHDAHVDAVFPKLKPDDPDLPGRVQGVASRLTRARDCLIKLMDANKVVVAGYHAFVNSGGGGGTNSVDLKPEFFATYSDKSRQATLVHESTHTMPMPWHTDDHCYIHQPQFQTAPLTTRYLNASHFEALIRLINGETLNLAAGLAAMNGGGAATPASLASQILAAAWIQAWRWHGDLAKEHKTSLTTINVKRGPSLDLIDQAHVLGLPWAKVEKGYFSTDITIRNSDLAFLENRAGKLGVLMGSAVVDKAVNAIHLNDPSDLTFTLAELGDPKLQVTKVEKILAKVIEFEGALRKSTNNRKTLDMIVALAEKKIENEKNDSVRPLVSGRYKQFLSTYPIKKAG